ncbi:hypothetical protein Goshw_002735 [Gossypium schwendimanii]|uniref:Endonuclease V n=1 Tax=Gossypium schwendimanii TaxID=34291 RepID=A0A7J9M1V4_GOSSC|nr:hypothetical protein [Gossypium schwendimanii]
MEGINEKEEAQKGSSPAELGKWAEIQDTLKKRVITVDDFPWRLASQSESEPQQQQLKYVGGVDVSFSKEEPSMACGSLVVLDLLHDLRLVYQEYTCLSLDIPYVPGFLAFREAPILLHLLAKMKKDASPFYPQVLMVDGNGLLHPRGKSVFYSIKCPYQLSPSLYFEVFPWPGFGLASHLGVIANIPTIGVGKNLHHVDGLTQSGVRKLLEAEENKAKGGVRKLLEAEENKAKGIITLRGNSGFIWGAAMRSEQGSLKPVFVSVGHRVSLETAIEIVNMTCKFRVPEPIRQISTGGITLSMSDHYSAVLAAFVRFSEQFQNSLKELLTFPVLDPLLPVQTFSGLFSLSMLERITLMKLKLTV